MGTGLFSVSRSIARRQENRPVRVFRKTENRDSPPPAIHGTAVTCIRGTCRHARYLHRDRRGWSADLYPDRPDTPADDAADAVAGDPAVDDVIHAHHHRAFAAAPGAR